MFNRLSVMTALFSAGVAAMPLTATLSLAQSYPPPPGYSQPLQTVPGGYAPDARGVQITPLGEVRITLPAPTATNKPAP